MKIVVTPLAGLPLVQPGDDVADLLVRAVEKAGERLEDQDVVVVTQKIVSKAEDRYADLESFVPSERALELSRTTGKDARLVEIILSESREVLRTIRGVLIVETHHGLVMANAGIDQSNLSASDRGRRVLLLPRDPDASAARIRERLATHFGADLGVIVSDSIGRAWRLGTVGYAIGAAGVPSLVDRRGEPDLSGRPLEVTEVGFADAVASAAVLAMGEAAEGLPAAIVRGLTWTAPARSAKALVRAKREDLFR